MDAPYDQEISRVSQFLARKEKEWHKHAPIAKQHDGPDETPAPIPFTSLGDFVLALQTRGYSVPFPPQSIPDAISRAIEPPRGLETVYGQIARITDMVAADIEKLETAVIRNERRIYETFALLEEELEQVDTHEWWTVVRIRRGCDMARLLTAAEDDVYYSPLNGTSIEVSDVASLEALRDAATEWRGHEKHLDFDASITLDNLRSLTPSIAAAKHEAEALLIDFMSELGVKYGLSVKRQSVITEYFKVEGADNDSPDEAMALDEESLSDEEMGDGEEWNG